jgi:outer membrane protein assembly factor BamB
MIRRCWLPIFALVLAAFCLPSLAIDQRNADKAAWPQWRGPHRDNISPDTGLLTEWSAEGPRLAWKAPGMGRGFSSITADNGKIYTMGDIEGGQAVIALSEKNGERLWASRIGDVWDSNGYAGPRCSPATDGTVVIAVGTHGDIACYNAKNGQEIWHRSFPKEFGGRMHSGWGFSESPLIDGNLVICTPGGDDAILAALNKKTGATVWQTKMEKIGDRGGDGAAYSSIVISNACGRKQYVQLVGRGAIGVDAKTGKFLWGYNHVANGTANIPTPVVQDDYVFVSTGYGTGAGLVKLEKNGDGIEAKEQYFLDAKDLQVHHGGMVVVGNYLYCGHGHGQGAPVCLEWKTGKFAWRQGRGLGEGSAAVGYADGNLYFRYENGVVGLIGATPDGYQLKGEFKIPDVNKPSWPQPVIIGGKLYLREQDNLLCYDVKK